MLKFIKHNMDTISGIEIYPIVALVIFFVFFAGLLVWVYTYKKDKIEEISHLPFEEELEINNISKNK
ncbi:cbb3-type cytochrome oxidase subunit 3 [Flavobacterium sp. JP2137]|uniref:cbb3-type cytochrome oxidase subunit 3 n=1 Tax=Flavobacterium sp. JP2137 TaxID=3414510 RepID=UPI003D2FEFB0